MSGRSYQMGMGTPAAAQHNDRGEPAITGGPALEYGGAYPAVYDPSDPARARLVFRTTSDEIKLSVQRLCVGKFGGDYHAGFLHYAGADKRLDKGELVRLLSDAKVDSMFSTERLASGVLSYFDKDPDSGWITWEEFQAAMAKGE